MRIAATIFLAAAGLVSIAAQEQRNPPPAAPAPGTAAIYKSAEALAPVLKAANPTGGGMTTSNVATTDQYGINIVHRAKPAGAVAHAGNTELHYIIEGSGTVITGGSLVRGATAGSATITNGVTQRVKKGDVVIVPANSPHWYSQIDSEITYLEVRWLAPR
jgi:mannose-6-phosphate isomerase-like protein (cupin superfamily)